MAEGLISAGEVRFFSGSSNPQLAGKIAAQLGVPLDGTQITRFSNDNLYHSVGCHCALSACVYCAVALPAGQRSFDGIVDDDRYCARRSCI